MKQHQLFADNAPSSAMGISERSRDDFDAYLREVVRRDQEGTAAEGLDASTVREALGSREKKPRQREKVAKTWLYHEQQQQLAAILAWRLGSEKARRISRDLMYEFGSLPAALSASRYRLSNVTGVGSRTIETLMVIREIAERMALAPLQQDKPILTNWNALINYLQVKTGFGDIERFHVIFLDKRNRLITDETHQTGTIDHTHVYPREIVRRCMELGASAIILCHNHPSGDASPSSADVRMTREVVDITKLLHITVHDHIIVGKGGHASLRALKLM